MNNITGPPTELRVGYGLMYESYGKVVHGLNRYNVIVGLRLPNMRIHLKYRPWSVHPDWCDQWDAPQFAVLYATCKNMWPTYQMYVDRIRDFENHVDKIITDDIPALLPGFHPSDLVEEIPDENLDELTMKVDKDGTEYVVLNSKDEELTETPVASRAQGLIGKIVSRVKRWISAVIGAAVEGFKALYSWQRDVKLQKGMTLLLRNQKALQTQMVEVKDAFMTLAKATADHLEALREDIQKQGKLVNKLVGDLYLFHRQVNQVKIRVNDNTQAIMFMSGTMLNLLTETERYLDLMQQIQLEFDHFLDAIDTLAKGTLSHSVISASALSKIIQHVNHSLTSTYPEYEILGMNVTWFYQIKLISYTYEKGMIGISIPIFLKPKLQEILDVYQLKTVHVPYHWNPDLIDEDESEATYTKLEPTSELLAMSSDTNLGLKKSDLDRCNRVGSIFMCEPLLLIQHQSVHTCESAIYHDLSVEVIKELCGKHITYWSNLDPPQVLLDVGDSYLLANLPQPWQVMCRHTDQIPSSIEGAPYVIVEKADLCGCDILAGNYYVQGNVKYCKELDTRIKLWYPINIMPMLWQFPDKIKTGNITDRSLYQSPMLLDCEEPHVVMVDTEGVYEDKTKATQIGMNLAMEHINQIMYKNKVDKIVDKIEFSGISWITFGIVGSIISIILAILVVPNVMKTCGISNKLETLSSTVGVLAVTMDRMNKVPMSQAYDGRKCLGAMEIQIHNVVDLLWIITQAFIILYVTYKILLYMYKFLLHVYLYYNTASLNSIQIMNTLWKHFIYDRTDLYVQLVNRQIRYSLDIYIGNYYGNPEDVLIAGKCYPDQMKLRKTWLYDYLEIRWMHATILFEDLTLQIPESVQLKQWQRCIIRNLFKKPDTCYRLVVINHHSQKVRSLTDLIELSSVDKVDGEEIYMAMNPTNPFGQPTSYSEGDTVVHVVDPRTLRTQTGVATNSSVEQLLH